MTTKPAPAADPVSPEWLTKRDGRLRAGLRDFMTVVLLNGEPVYRLEVRPAGGQYTCAVTQSVNGQRLDDGTARTATDAEALAAGLELLRAKLGW
jgi:hypothetical protein